MQCVSLIPDSWIWRLGLTVVEKYLDKVGVIAGGGEYAVLVPNT